MSEIERALVWPGALPVGLLRFIGVAKLAGALGLVLPAITRIVPRLTPIAASGLAIIQVLAIPFHLWCGETQMLPANLALLMIAACIAWAQFVKAPITTGRAIASRGNG
jgi:hypothetical protein